jgi:hypothetical protein
MRQVFPSVVLVLGVLAVGAPAGAASEIYKCTLPDGRVAYQDSPCATGEAEIVEIRGTAGGGRRARLADPSCMAIARELWRLNSTVNYTDMTADGRRRLEERRIALENQCRVTLAKSELSARCATLERGINRASAQGAAALADAGEEYDAICSESAIEDDIRRHLRTIGDSSVREGG